MSFIDPSTGVFNEITMSLFEENNFYLTILDEKIVKEHLDDYYDLAVLYSVLNLDFYQKPLKEYLFIIYLNRRFPEYVQYHTSLSFAFLTCLEKVKLTIDEISTLLKKFELSEKHRSQMAKHIKHFTTSKSGIRKSTAGKKLEQYIIDHFKMNAAYKGLPNDQ